MQRYKTRPNVETGGTENYLPKKFELHPFFGFKDVFSFFWQRGKRKR